MARFSFFIHSRPEVQLLGLHPPGFSRELVISKYVSKDTSEEADAMVENYVGFWLEVADNLVRSDHFSQVYYEQLIQAIKSSHELVLQFAVNGKHKESIYMMLYAALLAEEFQLKSLWPYTDLHHLCGVGRINPIGYDSQKMDNLMMNITTKNVDNGMVLTRLVYSYHIPCFWARS